MDFLGAVTLSQDLIDTIAKDISMFLPQIEKQERISIEMGYNLDQTKTKEKRATVFLFKNDDTSNKLMLEPDALSFELKKYEGYQQFKGIMEKVLYLLIKENSSLKLSRLGLRYINQINITTGSPFEWDGIIKSYLLPNMDFISKTELSRDLRLIELNKKECSVRFQYGLFNSEYPNPIAKKEFLLDYDCYTTNETDINSVITLIDGFHTVIKDLFKLSIDETIYTSLEETKYGQ